LEVETARQAPKPYSTKQYADVVPEVLGR
jgi:hypothetical protein